MATRDDMCRHVIVNACESIKKDVDSNFASNPESLKAFEIKKYRYYHKDGRKSYLMAEIILMIEVFFYFVFIIK